MSALQVLDRRFRAAEGLQPCNLGKRMSFHIAAEGEDPHSSIGYYRRVCPSRMSREGTR